MKELLLRIIATGNKILMDDVLVRSKLSIMINNQTCTYIGNMMVQADVGGAKFDLNLNDIQGFNVEAVAVSKLVPFLSTPETLKALEEKKALDEEFSLGHLRMLLHATSQRQCHQ